jgi:hypothetical protein
LYARKRKKSKLSNSLKENVLMKCLRCNSVMIYDKFYGHYEYFWGWKCVICGEIVDQVILENRELIRMGRLPNTRYRKM